MKTKILGNLLVAYIWSEQKSFTNRTLLNYFIFPKLRINYYIYKNTYELIVIVKNI